MRSDHTGDGGQPRRELQHGRTATILTTILTTRRDTHNIYLIMYRASGPAVVGCPVWGLA